MTSERKQIIEMIQEAHQTGARLHSACVEAGIALRTYRRWYRCGKVQEDQRKTCERRAPANKLTQEEREKIVNVCNEERYASLPPSQIVPDLLDQSIYYASESTYYRILKDFKQLNHRGRSLATKHHNKPTSYTATGPCQVWSWDITYLPASTIGKYYYLYLFMDIYSRKIVAYEVHIKECGELASQLLHRGIFNEKCFNNEIKLVLHSDNGAPMKSLTLKAKCEELGVAPSYSRPSVSNDNPYSESLFRTMKYRPEWPTSGYSTLEEAREWVEEFVSWYNHVHKHSRLNFVTPDERHRGRDSEILQDRKGVLEKAYQKTPERWSRAIRNCHPAGAVKLNPCDDIVLKKAV